jgi:mercuric ion binding protein
MKTVKFILVTFLTVLVVAGCNSQNQNKKTTSKTEEIKVLGECGMCKDRIEGAMKVDGIAEAVWNQETKLLRVTYNPALITVDDIQEKAAAVGHDTEKYRADDAVYASLPGCCHYERWN